VVTELEDSRAEVRYKRAVQSGADLVVGKEQEYAVEVTMQSME
jgi:hypothetical protein